MDADGGREEELRCRSGGLCGDGDASDVVLRARELLPDERQQLSQPGVHRQWPGAHLGMVRLRAQVLHARQQQVASQTNPRGFRSPLPFKKCLATLLLEMKSSQKSQQLKTSTGLQELEPGMRYSPGLGADVACSSSGGSGRVFCSRRCLVLRRIDSEYIVEVEQCNRLRPFKCTADHDSGGGFSRYTGYHGLGLGFLDAHRACEAARGCG